MASSISFTAIRKLAERINKGTRLTSRAVSVINAVPRFRCEHRLSTAVIRSKRRRVVEFRLRVPGSHDWSAWLSGEGAAHALRRAGFVDVALAQSAENEDVEVQIRRSA